MDGHVYEQWVAGVDVDTGRKKGRVPEHANALRFVEHGRGLTRVDPTQAAVVGALASDGPLLVVEGAAGAGKTTALRATLTCANALVHTLKRNSTTSPSCMT